MRQEKLDWLADNPFYTKRFAFFVGRRCRAMTIQDVARETRWDWHTLKALEGQYMREQLRRTGTPAPTVIGIDEISIRKGQTYRSIVSDLIRRRPIWCGGEDRSEESRDLFYQWLGPRKAKKIRRAVMDRWKACETSAKQNVPQAAMLYDTCHVMRHLGEALDTVRKKEDARVSGKDRSFIKGQKYPLLSRKENRDLPGRQSLRKLLKANKRLNAAYLLKETCGQLGSDETAGWARRFFDHWQASLKWQRLTPYEECAEMIERHWEGIAAYCHPENNVALGFVEGLNNKIRVMQRRAYGLRNEESLRLKVLTCRLKEI